MVGPNGSGKSNLIESLLFVFGKRAKKMRLNKISELIHNSKEHPNLREASVTVHFYEIRETPAGPGQQPHCELIPGSEFSVRRVVTRQNQSRYLINREESSFSAV